MLKEANITLAFFVLLSNYLLSMNSCLLTIRTPASHKHGFHESSLHGLSQVPVRGLVVSWALPEDGRKGTEVESCAEAQEAEAPGPGSEQSSVPDADLSSRLWQPLEYLRPQSYS